MWRMSKYAWMVCVLVAAIGRAETQTWTTSDGRAVEGEFVRLFGNTVAVKRPNGVQVSLPLSSLNEKSREQAKLLASQPKAKGASASGGFRASPAKASGIPTEAEIAAFLTEYKESPNSPETFELMASFEAPRLKPDQIKDYARKGKVPYRLTVTLYKTKEVDGRKQYQRQDGTGCFVVMNAAGDVIDRQRESLGKLCPS